MGVPKFFRWCAERYPTVITPFKDMQPPVDNLYLDMNGIIHQCSHSNDDAGMSGLTEKEMIQAMFVYLERLFNAIQPRKYFVLAVDGVAPRAKMNQQRQRRFRSGFDLMLAREKAKEEGLEVPDEKDVFDSNCITPGTPFMVRVSTEFQYFLTLKLSTDPAWQNCQVVFSGHDCPGEGEHKLMDFMRRRKMQPGYDPNETHCMYGLDADLIMLALVTHEPHFILLRELVTFGAASYNERMREEENAARGLTLSKSYRKEDEFVIFHIGVLRDYVCMDVQDKLLQAGADTRVDWERVIDDFVCMCFFIGNDFLPSIPTLGINDGSLLTMLEIYTEEVLARRLYLTNRGTIDWRVMELWLGKIGELELTTLQCRQQEEMQYQRNRQRYDPEHEIPVDADRPIESMDVYKDHFYRDKHQFAGGWDPASADMERMITHYVEGLSWVLKYYYQGVASWQWFYPHYYAPLASDLANLARIASTVKFTLGKPFLPHQQLLGVLPPMSYRSIPAAYWPLLRSPSSPLAKYFPDHISIDREGARAEWEGIVIIPFIKEQDLLLAYESVQRDVSVEDAKNNQLGPAWRFVYDPTAAPVNVDDRMFAPLRHVRVRREVFEYPPEVPFVPQLCPGVLTGDRQLEGFSSLQSKRHLIQASYEIGEVSIFGPASKRESLILNLRVPTDGGIGSSSSSSISHGKTTHVDDAVATATLNSNTNNSSSSALTTKSHNITTGGGGTKYDSEEGSFSFRSMCALLGKEVLVGFPHYTRARVAMVSNSHTTVRASYANDGSFTGTARTEHNRDAMDSFVKEADTHRRYMKSKLGISVAVVDVLVYVHRFSGMRANARGGVRRQFATGETCYPAALVCTLEEIRMRPDARYVEKDSVAIDFARGTRCVFLGPTPRSKPSASENTASHASSVQTYGACGIIREVDANHKNHFTLVVRVPQSSPTLLPPPALHTYASRKNWTAQHEVAQRLGYRGSTISLITGTMQTTPQYGSRELGLCMKLVSRGLARVGYAKMVQRVQNAWYRKLDYFARLEQDAEVMGHHLMKTDKTDYVGKSRLPHSTGGMGTVGSDNNSNTANSLAKRNDSGVWYFSQDAVALLTRYIDAFRPLVERIDAGGVNPFQVELQQCMTGPWSDRAVEDVIDEVEGFLSESGVLAQPMVNASDDAYPADYVHTLEDALDAMDAANASANNKRGDAVAADIGPMKEMLLRQVSKSYVYVPLTRSTGGHLIQLPLPVEQTFYLGARVVNCRATGAVPFGARGTIVRLLASGRDADVVFDVPFVGATRLDGRLRESRGAVCKFATLLVTSASSTRAEVDPDTRVTRGTAQAVTSSASPSSATASAAAAAEAAASTDPLRPLVRSSTEVSPQTIAVTPITLPTPTSSSAAMRSAARVASPVSAVTVSAAGPNRGGIQVRDLFGKLQTPTSASAATVVPSFSSSSSAAAAVLPTKPTMTGSIDACVSAAQRESGSVVEQSQQQRMATKTGSEQSKEPSSSVSSSATTARKPFSSYAIPADFLSGRIRVSHVDAATTFKKWLDAFVAEEIDIALRNDGTA